MKVLNILIFTIYHSFYLRRCSLEICNLNYSLEEFSNILHEYNTTDDLKKLKLSMSPWCVYLEFPNNLPEYKNFTKIEIKDRFKDESILLNAVQAKTLLEIFRISNINIKPFDISQTLEVCNRNYERLLQALEYLSKGE